MTENIKMAFPEWDGAARFLLQKEKRVRALNNPEPVGALIKWRGNTYFGHIQAVASNFSNEIMALTKTSNPIPDELTRAIKKLDPGRLELEADAPLDMTGKHHILRKAENRLTQMTRQQTEYMLLHPVVFQEVN